jgi:glycosyltransferase involved in cell wall biosynthesis
MSRLRVAYVLGTASGGTARHAGMLAAGCRRAGLEVIALGPELSRDAFAAGAATATGPDNEPERPCPASPADTADVAFEAVAICDRPRPVRTAGVAFETVAISDRPRPVRDLAALARLRRLLRRAGPDVVHAHGLRAGVFAALALLPSGADRRAALVVTVHNTAPQGHLARVVYGLLELICARRASVVLCASDDLTARMRQLGATAPMTFDVPAPAARPPSAGAVARARADIATTGRPAVLAVGRLAEQKGFDTLLAAAADWGRRAPVPTLAIAGEGPLDGELAATASRTGVDLTLLGARDDVPALLGAADLVVVPSRWEARALIVQEALRAGRPIVASRVGGIPDLTGEDAALLVPPGDAGKLAAAMLAVLDDPALAARLSAAALARAGELPSPSDAVTAILAIYQRVIAGRRPTRARAPTGG